MKDPILITGCARSGTSMTAGIINICGAFGGDMFGPNKNNQKGMFENKEIRQNVVKPYLKKIGVDQLGQKPLPNNRQVFEVSDEEVVQFRKKVQKVFQQQGKSLNLTNADWFYKGAKICLIWYLWACAFPRARWIVVRRRKEDIINSCLRTTFMRAYKNEEGWARWVDVHERRFDEMRSAGLDIFEFWPSVVIEGNFDHAEEMINHLGLEYRDNLVKAFVDPTLYRRKSNG